MDQLLDLSIALTVPPNGSPPEIIASLDVRCDGLGLAHAGDLLTDPLTEKERLLLRWDLEEYWKWPYEGFAQRGRQVEALLADIGRRLYAAAFGSAKVASIVQAWRLQPEVQRQISLLSDIPQALKLPWELLHDEQGFLALRTHNPVSILRRLPQSELAAFSTSFEPPLRILLVTARPEDTGFVDPRGIARELLDEVQEQVLAGTMALEFLRPPTLRALRTRLSDSKRPSIHVLHFDGHGTFGEKLEEGGGFLLSSKQGIEEVMGKLAFEDEDGKLELVKGSDLAQILQNSGIRLAILTACESAMSASDDAFSSMAAQLIQSGLDAVAAMSTSILVASASRYVEAFYRAIAAGTPAPTAQERARQALHDDPRRHIYRRGSDDEGVPVLLRDWWLPHFYQQRSLTLIPSKQAHRPRKRLTNISERRLNAQMPGPPRYGFTGRAYELLQIERWLMRHKLVVIHGFGGIGKTALVREAADWLTHTQMYDRACYISFEHGGDTVTMLSALGNYLEVYDGHYNPHDSKAALKKLEPVLKKQRTLVLADNLESIMPNGQALLERSLRQQLWSVLLELTNQGAGVLLVSQNTAFDGQLVPGKDVVHLQLEGLHPEDAYALSIRLLRDLDIDRTHITYRELRDLLAQLDYHPLAIQLVLPALDSLPITTIKTEFSKFLFRFADNTPKARNQSLLASLNYSLQRLSPVQQVLLRQLVPFESIVLEGNLLLVTGMPEAEWSKFRSALEQAGLVTVEHPGPFLHFHPVLAPFLRDQLGGDDNTLHQSYAQHYYTLAYVLYHDEAHFPLPTREWVWRELPNLRRALGILIESGDREAASRMTEYLVKFLDYFGLWRERDELRKLVATKATSAEGILTYEDWLNESGLGDIEFSRGDLRAASTRFTALLLRHEALPRGAPLGRGSYEHCLTINRLARCLMLGKQPTLAERRLREALTVIDALIEQKLDDEISIRQRASLLHDLGTLLLDLDRYSEAERAYEEGLKVARQLEDVRSQSATLQQLARLSLRQGKHDEARSYCAAARDLIGSLGEPAQEAMSWHQLGEIASAQEEWHEAERCYRECLAIAEQLGDWPLVVKACGHLATIATMIGHLEEAESWWKRALELEERIQPGSALSATMLSGIATLLLLEVQAGYAPVTGLIEARAYAERALAIRETFEVSSDSWTTLDTLADIAELEGDVEVARSYRRRERETFAAFSGHRSGIDREYGQLIEFTTAAAKGNVLAREVVKKVLEQKGATNKLLTNAVERICAGERNWHSLVENMNVQDSLLVLRVLETIAQPTDMARVQKRVYDDFITTLPVPIREALERGEVAALQQAFAALPSEEQQAVREVLHYLQEQQNVVEEEDQDTLRIETVVQEFDPVLQAIAGVARGDSTKQSEIEVMLDDLEAKGWHLKEAVQHIWAGERHATALTRDLDKQDTALVERVLEILAQSIEVLNSTPEQRLASLSVAMRNAMARGDEVAFHQALEVLAPEERQAALQILHSLQSEYMATLLIAIARIAIGETIERNSVEKALDALETRGIRLRKPVQRLWNGERDVVILTEGLDENEAVLIQRILEMIAES